MLKVDTGGSAVVFADTASRTWQLQAAQVFGEGFIGKRLEPGTAAAHHAAQVELRVALDQRLRQRRRADQEEPVPVGAGEGLVGLGVHRQGWRNIQQHHALHGLGMVQRQAMGDPGTTVVGQYRERVKAQRLHQFDAVAGHFPLRVVAVVIVGRRLAAITVAAQVGGHHAEMLGQLFGDFVPDDVGLRVPVQQEQTRTCTAFAVADVHAVDVALVFLESGEHGMTPRDDCLHPGITQHSGQGGKRVGVVHEVCRSLPARLYCSNNEAPCERGLAGDGIDAIDPDTPRYLHRRQTRWGAGAISALREHRFGALADLCFGQVFFACGQEPQVAEWIFYARRPVAVELILGL